MVILILSELRHTGGLISVSGGLISDSWSQKPDPMDLKSDPGGLKSGRTETPILISITMRNKMYLKEFTPQKTLDYVERIFRNVYKLIIF